jgi:hypothetical protein
MRCEGRLRHPTAPRGASMLEMEKHRNETASAAKTKCLDAAASRQRPPRRSSGGRRRIDLPWNIMNLKQSVAKLAAPSSSAVWRRSHDFGPSRAAAPIRQCSRLRPAPDLRAEVSPRVESPSDTTGRQPASTCLCSPQPSSDGPAQHPIQPLRGASCTNSARIPNGP